MKKLLLFALLIVFPVLMQASPSPVNCSSNEMLSVQKVEKANSKKKTKKAWKKELRKKKQELRKSKAKSDSKPGAVFLTILAGIAAMALLAFGLFLLDAVVGLGILLELFTLVGIGVIIYFMVKIIKNILKNPSGG